MWCCVLCVCAGLKGNPLPSDIMNMYNEPNGTQRLLTFLLDNLNSQYTLLIVLLPSKHCLQLGSQLMYGVSESVVMHAWNFFSITRSTSPTYFQVCLKYIGFESKKLPGPGQNLSGPTKMLFTSGSWTSVNFHHFCCHKHSSCRSCTSCVVSTSSRTGSYRIKSKESYCSL